MSFRSTYLLGFLLVILLLGLAFYVQMYEGVAPCPLCILQRFALIGLGILFFLGALLPLKKMARLILSFFTVAIALSGSLLAGRQVWLQHLPSGQATDCGASLDYLLKVLPLDQAIQKIFMGSAECSQVSWRFLHLSLAEWSLFWFILFIVLALLQFKRALVQKR